MIVTMNKVQTYDMKKMGGGSKRRKGKKSASKRSRKSRTGWKKSKSWRTGAKFTGGLQNMYKSLLKYLP